jgi:hypothetical protein
MRKKCQTGFRTVKAHAIGADQAHAGRVCGLYKLIFESCPFAGSCFTETGRKQYGSFNAFGGTFTDCGQGLLAGNQNDRQVYRIRDISDTRIRLEAVNCFRLWIYRIYSAAETLIQKRLKKYAAGFLASGGTDNGNRAGMKKAVDLSESCVY